MPFILFLPISNISYLLHLLQLSPLPTRSSLLFLWFTSYMKHSAYYFLAHILVLFLVTFLSCVIRFSSSIVSIFIYNYHFFLPDLLQPSSDLLLTHFCSFCINSLVLYLLTYFTPLSFFHILLASWTNSPIFIRSSLVFLWFSSGSFLPRTEFFLFFYCSCITSRLLFSHSLRVFDDSFYFFIYLRHLLSRSSLVFIFAASSVLLVIPLRSYFTSFILFRFFSYLLQPSPLHWRYSLVFFWFTTYSFLLHPTFFLLCPYSYFHLLSFCSDSFLIHYSHRLFDRDIL